MLPFVIGVSQESPNNPGIGILLKDTAPPSELRPRGKFTIVLNDDQIFDAVRDLFYRIVPCLGYSDIKGKLNKLTVLLVAKFCFSLGRVSVIAHIYRDIRIKSPYAFLIFSTAVS